MCRKPRKPWELMPAWRKNEKFATHRGYGKRGEIGENTIAAFVHSTEKGFFYHELDVRATKDNKIILFHGPLLESTTSGKGRLEDLDSSDLIKIDWDDYLKNEIFVATPYLEHYFEEVAPKVITNIELKRDWFDTSHGLEAETVRLIRKHKLEKRVFISSFNPFALRRFHKLAPDIGIGLLVNPGLFFDFRETLLRHFTCPDFIHPPEEACTKKRIAKWKKKGYSVHVWTVDSLERAKELISWGADLIITNNMDIRDEYNENP